MIEEAIKTTKNNSFHNLNTQFSKLTAEVQIIASEKVIEKYLNVANLFQDWANSLSKHKYTIFKINRPHIKI